MEGRQIRAARALLDWTRGDLAAASGLSLSAVLRLESGGSDPRRSTLLAVEEAFRVQGVTMFADSGGGIGVILNESKASPRRESH